MKALMTRTGPAGMEDGMRDIETIRTPANALARVPRGWAILGLAALAWAALILVWQIARIVFAALLG